MTQLSSSMENMFPSAPLMSKVWVFQSNRIIQPADLSFISIALNNFLSTWKSHGATMISDYKVIHNHFLILTVDNSSGNDASGCGIDALVQEIKSIGEKTQIDFFDNGNVAFFDGSKIFTIKHADIRSAIDSGKLQSGMKTFNNSVSTIGDLNSKWFINVEDSWISRYFKKSNKLAQ